MTNALGMPIAAAVVTTSPATGTAQSDAQGAFQISGISVSGNSAAYTVTAVKLGEQLATATATPTRTNPTATVNLAAPRTLRASAAAQGLHIGSATHWEPFSNLEQQYSTVLAREFSQVASGWELFWGTLRPTQTTYDFTRADAMLAFAETNQMTIHGHVLVYHSAGLNPAWLLNGNFDRNASLAILKDHIFTVMNRYRGKIATWDVLNEAITDPGEGVGLRETFWRERIGDDYADSAFTWARQADPAAKLYYNDYAGEGLGEKSDRIYFVQGLKARGIPIDGVGLQMHVTLSGLPPPLDVRANLERLAALGLDVRISEMDVRIEGAPGAAQLAQQGRIYHDILRAVLGAPRLVAITFWGFTDRRSWIPGAVPGWGAAHVFDENDQSKPAYDALHLALSNQ